MQTIESIGKPKLLSQAIGVLLTDEQRPRAPATFTLEQFMQNKYSGLTLQGLSQNTCLFQEE